MLVQSIQFRNILFITLLLTSSTSMYRAVAEAPGLVSRFERIPGTLLIVGGGRLPDSVIDRFVELAGGNESRLVVIPTATERADRNGYTDELTSFWSEHGIADVTVLHTRNRVRSNDPGFLEPLNKATAIWFGGGDQRKLVEAYGGTALVEQVHQVLDRGGVVGGTSAGAAVMSRVMITGGNPEAEVDSGLGLIQQFVIDQHFLHRDRVGRLIGVLGRYPGAVGLGIDERTAVEVSGRLLRVVGESYATLIWSAGRDRPIRFQVLDSLDIADLVASSNAGLARADSEFDDVGLASREVVVPTGALLIHGGGRLLDSTVERFIELAGGPDAPLVVIPSALGDPIPNPDQAGEFFERSGFRDVTVLHRRYPEDVPDKEFREALERAQAVWFGGGRQWRLVDAYGETEVEAMFRGVLERGGVIGGSSAGASIQAEYMVRGNPLGNTDMMAEGYERGFGFLPGAAVDQHFAQRGRFPDLAGVVERFPELLGLGIDENTAVVVQGSTLEVIGGNRVAIYDRSGRNPGLDPNPRGDVVLESGQRFDLSTRRVIEQEPH